MTPDTVQTRIGTLNFVDGVPTAETTQKRLRQSRLPARRGSLPQLHSRHVDRSDAPAATPSCGATSSTPGHHLRSVDRFQSAVAHAATPTPCTASVVPRPRDAMVRPSSRFRRAAGRARSTTRSSASSSTWACPAPMRGKGGKYLIVPAGYKGDAAEGREGRRRVLRRAFAVVRELADPARLPRRRQAGRGVEDVPRKASRSIRSARRRIRRRWSSSTARRCRSTRSTPTTSSSTKSSTT